MAVNEACQRGNEITSIDRCKEAEEWILSLGLNPQRSLKTASWDNLPFQCSVEARDDTFHFNTDDKTDNSRFTNGDFVMICEKGK